MVLDLFPSLDGTPDCYHVARERLYDEAWERWGEHAQVAMLAEEATELSLAVQQDQRGRDSNVAEEIADVLIMLEQVCSHRPDLWAKAKEEAQGKLRRLARRLEAARKA